jgi:FtsP/CotA-like multicopper oxidase with cupredoxin domain
VDLQPGYRSDVLVKATTTEGTYDLVDRASPANRGLRTVAEDTEVLAQVVVRGEPVDMELPTQKEMSSLAPFPGVDLQEEAVDLEHAQFDIEQDVNPDKKKRKLYFSINFFEFDPERVRKLALGSIAEWKLTAPGGTHVFHIHVNPFQVVRTDPDGNPETVWKDTLAIDGQVDPKGVSVYTRYDDFTGKFVIHCHILDHEDLGMMEAVKVVRPGAVIGPRRHAAAGH